MGLWRKQRERGHGGRVFRPVLLALVVAAVCWGFWQNSQRRLDAILLQGSLRDETGAFSSAYKEELGAEVKGFKKEFGIPLEVAVLRQPPPLDRHNSARIYFDIVPVQRRAYLFLPPLVRHAVGDAFVRDLEASFQQGFTSGDWRPGVLSAILALRVKLTEVTR